MPTFGVASGVLWEVLDRKVMLIDGAASELVTLNAVGSFVWCALATQSRTVTELAEMVTGAFPEVGLARAAADVESFVEELARLGFLSSAT